MVNKKVLKNSLVEIFINNSEGLHPFYLAKRNAFFQELFSFTTLCRGRQDHLNSKKTLISLLEFQR